MTGSQIGIIILLSISTALVSMIGLYVAQYFRTRRRLFESHRNRLVGPPRNDADLDFKRAGQTRALLSNVEALAIRLSGSRGLIDQTDRKMMQAGFYHPNAASYFRIIRAVYMLVVPIIVIFILNVFLQDIEPLFRYLFLALIALISMAVPEVVMSRRIAMIQEHCRNGFPDFLDLMVVATEAGMSLEAALARVSAEMSRYHQHLGWNLYLTNIEIRLGLSLGDALQSLADRVGIEEIRGFVTTLVQSREYGTSIADTLRIFSDDMRDKRQMTAEEKAQELPVKLIFPLALFLLPVMMLVAIWPVVTRIKQAFGGG